MLLRQRNHGKLVTILHLNGNKMKSASLLSLMTDKELCDYFSSQGFTVFIISANHVEMINTVAKIDKMFISNAKLNSNFYPIIILKSPKGMTGPQQMNGLPFVGSFYSHKPPN